MYYVGSLPAIESDVCHYGRIGMKWYQHIYTNDDGSPRKSKEINDDINTINKSVTSGSSVTRSASNIADRLSRRRKPTKAVQDKLSKMSDNELRDYVNRMDLERRYRDLTGDTVRSGAVTAKDVLDTVGDVVGIVGGVLGIALLAGKLRHPGVS